MISKYALEGDDLDPFVLALTEEDLAAAQALYDDRDLEVGYEGIGGFAAGQAERTIAALARAGFKVSRSDKGSDKGSTTERPERGGTLP